MATLQCPSGLVWKVSSNLGCVSPHFHGLRLYGTEATFVNGLPDATIFRPAAPPQGATPEPVTAAYPGVHKGDLIAPFIESIVTGQDHGVTAENVFETLSVCFAIERAHREQRPAEVTWL